MCELRQFAPASRTSSCILHRAWLFDRGQLVHRIDAQRFARLQARSSARTSCPSRFSTPGTIGQVVFALGIVGANPVQGVEQDRGSRRHSNSDSLRGSAFARRVASFSSTMPTKSSACVVATMRPKPGRIVLVCRCPGCRPAGGARIRPAALRSSRLCISGESPATTSTGPSCPARCSRHIITACPVPQLLGLQDERDARPAGQGLPHVVGPIADDDDDPRRRRPRPARRARSRSSAGRRPAPAPWAARDFMRVPLPAAITTASVLAHCIECRQWDAGRKQPSSHA